MKEYCFRSCYKKENEKENSFLIIDTRLFVKDDKVCLTHKITDTDTNKVYENDEINETNIKYDPFTGEKII